MYDATNQKIIVPVYVFLLGNYALAVATAANHGIVTILNAINAINAGTVIPVACIIA